MRYYVSVLFAVTILAIPWAVFNFPIQTHDLLYSIQEAARELAAVVVAHNPKTVAELQSRYSSATPEAAKNAHKIRILLVPGHEPDYGGAEYGSLKERNMTVELAQDLQRFLSNNPRFEVMTTRDTQSWSPVFANYFKTQWNVITAWQQAHKNEIINLTRLGKFHPITPDVIHRSVPNDVAMRIYGINKWADDHDVDIVIHIHFNDYPGHPGVPGDYSGFSIYVPQTEYDNSSTTRALADAVFTRLAKYNAVSDLPGESGGIVEDQDLIAIGAYNSVDAASMLIEYGYLYEPQFANDALRSTSINDLAFQTYLGLQDFLDPRNAVSVTGATDTLIMPHAWRAPITSMSASSTDVFALQTALILDGDYPPHDMTKNDCPRTGRLGPCTKTALTAFQKKYNILGEDGVAGTKTIEVLNRLFKSID